MSKETALSWIDENEKKIIGLSDKAWEYAEVGLLEYETPKLFADAIEKESFSVERGISRFSERSFRRLVNDRLWEAMLVRIRSWLSFRVLRMSLRRSLTPPVDIGVDAHPPPVP